MAQTIMRQVFADIENTRETWPLPAATGPHVAVEVNGRVGVTLSGTPGAVHAPITLGPITLSGLPQGDNGQGALKSSIHTTGTFAGAVVGGDNTTEQNTPVYLEADGSLNLTEGAGVLFGYVNFPEGYIVSGTVLPIKIGA
jgi:hypothetical protein